ncbi:MAG TPA: LysM peptidoglycan-binding domain-containing protein [Thermoanaerobacterales bacterium]|nr:LysM peptidoglycan-binding domain-containing protein [Thermoanaerobacterales bacterium]
MKYKFRNNRVNMIKYIIITILSINMMLFCLIFNQSKVISKPDDKYIKITVKKGQTLWGIASDYKPEGVDIRKVIYEIKKENNMQNALIMPGQIIRIPEL